MTAQATVGERCASMWAEIFDGEEFTVDVIEREFFPILEFDSGAAPRWHVFNPPDRDDFARAWWAFEVTKFGIGYLHYVMNRNKLRRVPAKTR